MRARHLDDTHRRAGIKGCDALRGCSPPATRGAPQRPSTWPLSGTSKDVPQRGHTRSETVLASKTTASTPLTTLLLENVWTKCYQYETLVQEV